MTAIINNNIKGAVFFNYFIQKHRINLRPNVDVNIPFCMNAFVNNV